MSEEAQQQFIVFLNSCTDDLYNNRLSPEEALVAIRQFPYLNHQILEQLDEIDVVSGQAFKNHLLSFLQRIIREQKIIWSKLSDRELTPAPPLSEKEVVERARELHSALGTAVLIKQKQRVAFARKLAHNWARQLRLSREQEDELTNDLVEDIQTIPASTKPQEFKDQVIKAIETKTALVRLSKNLTQKDILAEEQKLQAGIASFTRTIIEHNGPKIVALASAIQQKLESAPPQTAGQFQAAIFESERLVRVAEVLTSDVVPAKEAVHLSLGGALSAFAGSDAQAKIGLFIGNTVGLFFNRDTQEKIINAIVSKSESRLAADTSGLYRQFGEAIKSQEFQVARQAMAAAGESYDLPKGLAGAATGFLTSAVGTKLIGSPSKLLLTTLELEIKKILTVETFLGKKKQKIDNLPQGFEAGAWATTESFSVFYKKIYLGLPHYGYLTYLYLSDKASFSFSKIGDFVGWFLNLKTVTQGAEMAAGKLAQGGIRAFLARFLMVGGGILRGPLGAAATWFGGKTILGSLGKVFGGLLGFLSNPAGVLGEAPGKIKKWHDPSTATGLAALLIIGLIVVLLFPIFFGSVIPLAMVTSSKGSGPPEESPEQFPIPSNLPVATGPMSCPVDNGQVTQRPFEGYSHQGVDAFDIAAIDGSVVKATHDAVVVKIVDGFAKNQFAYGNFGNYVRLAGKNDKGETFWTTYAHLLGADANLTEGKTIKAGDTIGYVDNTGYSEGTHLHYQYNGPGRLVLPKGCAGA